MASITSKEIRQSFLEFFREKGHRIVPSAPMVLKDDPTLMFTNAGMNQFKDYFLGNREPESLRVADTQKCLRVTGKHNDLEEVGHDTYHHTMFEMLGNWSFGDYFKEEAIDWAWEFLTARAGLDPERIYATVFKGDPEDGVPKDSESQQFWSNYLPSSRILEGSKTDNFWEMGDTGPCGPCSEIHLDLRDPSERKKTPGGELVNRNHPLVIEIWNLVFIQFNRRSDGRLDNLPQRHVDTGMGFERLCMALQNKTSNYDTDLFRPLLEEIAKRAAIPYGEDPSADVAMRVVADHLRAIAFSVADGQLPSNNKAGYVIRRILRRAVRYGFTYLGQKKPFIHTLVPALVDRMGDSFPELKAQQALIGRVIREEEDSFLVTLDTGIRLLEQRVEKAKREKSTLIPGEEAFELYDTYGFPLDLTELILAEQGMKVDKEGFRKAMAAQKERSRQAAGSETGDWTFVQESGADPQAGGSADAEGGQGDAERATTFVGYEQLSSRVHITRYRKVVAKKKTLYHLVFDHTPFYAESGGQIGDRGYIESGEERVEIIDTRKENELIVHLAKRLPTDPSATFMAHVNEGRRTRTANNHTATHLMHHALREVLGEHVEQKGSLVDPDYLRFDFSHFQKVTDEELREIEKRVNRMIRRNSRMEELQEIPVEQALDMGALALFGEKYGERVRVVRFGDSVELCGGTHVKATGQIGIFKILRESSIAAGIRRIEAVTGETAEEYINERIDTLGKISGLFEKQKDVVGAVARLQEEHSRMSKQLEEFRKNALGRLADDLEDRGEKAGAYRLIVSRIDVEEAGHLRDVAFRIRDRLQDFCLVVGTEIGGKAHLAIMLSDSVQKSTGLDAASLIREIAGEIQGGGGGQPFFATAGGRNPAGIDAALQKARRLIASALDGPSSLP